MMPESKIDLTGDSGVIKEILVQGIGDELPSGSCKVSLNYVGKFTDGTIFDSSLERNEPFEFVLGRGSVIKAFDIGVATMKKKEKCILTCAPRYAYGFAESPAGIPPGSTLIFELEMLDWKGEDLSPNSDMTIERFIVTKSLKKKTPNEGAYIKVHLVGKYDNRIFEERDVEFNHGEGEDHDIIEGIEIALLKFCVGETSRLVIKPKYAFGAKGSDTLNVPPNATVEYLITLNECERGIEEWKLDEGESLVQAKIFKEKGTVYVKKEKFKLAITMYNKSNNYLSKCAGIDEGKQLRLANFLNLALCYQKLDDNFKAKNACNDALYIDNQCVKALYRRGQSLLAVGDYELALKDFESVHKIDSNNKAAINKIAFCKSKIKEFVSKEKHIYKNMFVKFAAADKQKEDFDRGDEDVLISCGEWTEEEARKEADKAFERDNNIIMLN